MPMPVSSTENSRAVVAPSASAGAPRRPRACSAPRWSRGCRTRSRSRVSAPSRSCSPSICERDAVLARRTAPRPRPARARAAAAARTRSRVGRRRRGLQRRQREQVVDEALHALGLRRHQADVVARARGVELQVLDGLEKAREHRERRAQLVRDVGDEVAAHRLDARRAGDVPRQQQVLPRRRRRRSAATACAGRRGARQPHRLGEIAGAQVFDELRRAHQVDDRLACGRARDRGRGARAAAVVAPLDAVSARRGSTTPSGSACAAAPRARDQLVGQLAPAPERGARGGGAAASQQLVPGAVGLAADRSRRGLLRASASSLRSRAQHAQPAARPRSAQPPAARRPMSSPAHAARPRPIQSAAHGAAVRAASSAQAVAAAAHGLDQRSCPVGASACAQPADVHVDRALLDEHVVAPDLVEQLRAASRRGPGAS